MNNIFIALSKFPSSIESNPVENQFTEAFSYVMNIDKELLKYVLMQIFKHHSNKPLDFSQLSNLEIKTQVQHYNNGAIKFIDLEISLDKYIFFIENKLESPINKEQLESYLSVLERIENKKNHQGFLILITKNSNVIQDDFIFDNSMFIKCRWFEIFEYIDNYSNEMNQEPIAKEFTKQFLRYMEEKDMKPFEAFNPDQLQSWKNYVKLIDNISKILEETKDIVIKKGYRIAGDNDTLDYKGFYFYPETWKKQLEGKADIDIYFEFDTEDYKSNKCIWCSISCYLNKDIKNDYYKPLKSVYNNLERMGFIEDKQYFYRWVKLENITRKFTDSKEQKRKIINFFIEGLEDIEKSGWNKAVSEIFNEKK